MKRLLAIGLVVIGVAALANGLWIPVKAAVAQVLLRDAWWRTLDGAAPSRPWPWADTVPVARMIIERTGSDFIVLSGSSGRVLAFAPGHLENTALPGERGNCVIAGHRDTHFAVLRDLRDGDVVSVQRADGSWHRYAVAGRRVVDKRDTWVTRSTSARTLTLVTCYPFDAVVAGGPERLVVQLSVVSDQLSGQTSPDNRQPRTANLSSKPYARTRTPSAVRYRSADRSAPSSARPRSRPRA